MSNSSLDLPNQADHTAEQVVSTWVATAYGALDVSGSEAFDSGTELVVLPTEPSEPMALIGDGAALWRRMVGATVSDDELSDVEQQIVREMQIVGLTSSNPDHPARVRNLPKPWLTSPVHELVNALIASLARDNQISAVIIKGPTLHAQGIRDQQHSGDVDVWVHPNHVEHMAQALGAWGWQGERDLIGDTIAHSISLYPAWGCEIDVHFRFPGTADDVNQVFAALEGASEAREFAGVEARVPSAPAHAIIHALHKLRPEPGQQVSPALVSSVADRLANVGEDSYGFAVAAGSAGALKEPLSQAFPHLTEALNNAPVPRDWAARQADTKAKFYAEMLGSTGWRDRVRMFRGMVWPNDDWIRRSHAFSGGDPNVSVLRMRVQRLNRGIKQALVSARHKLGGP